MRSLSNLRMNAKVFEYKTQNGFLSVSRRFMSTPVVEPSTYIKEMVDIKDWDTAMENTTRPVLI